MNTIKRYYFLHYLKSDYFPHLSVVVYFGLYQMCIDPVNAEVNILFNLRARTFSLHFPFVGISCLVNIFGNSVIARYVSTVRSRD